jgi:hypothetical protein
MGFWSVNARRILLVASLAALTACKRTSPTEDSASVEGTPECEAYASDYERCLQAMAPDRATADRLAENTRLALQSAVKDESSRVRLNDECRTAREQLRRTCP